MSHRARTAGLAIVFLALLLAGGFWWMTTKPQPRTITLSAAPTQPTPDYQLDVTFITSPKLDAELARANENWIAEPNGLRWPHWLEDGECLRLANIARGDENGSVYKAPRLLLENAISNEVRIGRNANYVADLKVITQNGTPTTKPIIRGIESGVSIRCIAQPARDADAVKLDLTLQSTSLHDITTRPWKAPSGTKIPEQVIQQPVTLQTRLTAWPSIPLGLTALYRVTPIRTPPLTQPGLKEWSVFLLIHTQRVERSTTPPTPATR